MTGPNPEFQQQLKALRDEYEAKLPARLRELDACFKRLPTDGGAGESRQGLENLPLAQANLPLLPDDHANLRGPGYYH